MKKTLILGAILTATSFSSFANIEISRDRVVCENEASIQVHIKRKDNRKMKMTDGCRVLEIKRIGEVEKIYRGRGYAKIDPKFGDKFYVDIDAISKK